MAEDRELLTQFLKDGSRSALSTLVERYRKMVYAVCLRELGDPDDAADATQATFVLLQSSASRINRREKLGAWLYTAARHVCRNARRERFQRRKVEGAALDENAAYVADTPAPLTQGDAVMSHFHRLPEGDRVALSLRYLNGMSVKEVGASLGIAEQAAQMRLSRALDRFRNLLQGAGLAIAIPDLDRTLHGELPWDPPKVALDKESRHRWATRLRPEPGKVLLKVAGSVAASFVGFVALAPPLLMMAIGQVPANPLGMARVWQMMAAGFSGADRIQIEAGRWIAEDQPGQGPDPSKREIVIMESPNRENMLINIAETSLANPSRRRETSIQVQRWGDEWRLNGARAVTQISPGFDWGKGDLQIVSETDRSSERLTIHAEGYKVRFTHERGGSLKSLKVEQSFEALRQGNQTITVDTKSGETRLN